MATRLPDSGIPAVGHVHWGAHFCQFYETAEDLAAVLVPFFKAGLEAREQCLWVTSKPFGADDARAALRAAEPRLDALEKAGQIEIVDHRDWYRRQEKLAPHEVLRTWLAREEAARAAGYEGLRLTGNTFWLQKHQWSAFADYERTVNEGFRGRRVVALCSYCLPRCRGTDVLDVVRNHEFAVARRGGEWEVVESAALALAKQELRQLNQELDGRVAERTAELRQALDDNDALFRELHHRVRNNLQLIRSLLALKARQIAPGTPARAFTDAANRINAIGLVHDVLYSQGGAGDVDMGAYLRALAEPLLVSHELEGRVAVEVRASGAGLRLTEATPVGMIANEILLNALRHAFPDGRAGRVEVACERDGSTFRLTICDDGVGLSAPFEALARPLGGLTIVRGLASQLGGTMVLRNRGGAEFQLEFPSG